MSTLTIRIDAELKDDIMEIAHRSGEDASMWIRRFFERIRASETSKEKGWVGDEDGAFSKECIQSVLEARTSGIFKPFDLKKYV